MWAQINPAPQGLCNPNPNFCLFARRADNLRIIPPLHDISIDISFRADDLYGVYDLYGLVHVSRVRSRVICIMTYIYIYIYIYIYTS